MLVSALPKQVKVRHHNQYYSTDKYLKTNIERIYNALSYKLLITCTVVEDML